MGRAEAGTPKAIANKMKAKGLLKLKYFCEMCQKSCRDENGFKCHKMSESHLRQMKLFSENPDHFMQRFSSDFEAGMMEILSRRYRTVRVSATVWYNEYIQDKLHVHMNATKWETLTDFVTYLGKTGKCVVDQTEKGWFVRYIDRDPALLAREAAFAQREVSEADETVRIQRSLDAQADAIRKVSTQMGEADAAVEMKLFNRGNADDKLTFSLAKSTVVQNESESFNFFQGSSDQGHRGVKRDRPGDIGAPVTTTNGSLDGGVTNEKLSRPSEHWLHKHLIVKVMSKNLASGKYYQKKGEIMNLHTSSIGDIRMIESGDTIRLSQDYLETVIPALGRKVVIVNGSFKGSAATLVSIDKDSFSCTVDVNGKILRVPYEDICKSTIVQ